MKLISALATLALVLTPAGSAAAVPPAGPPSPRDAPVLSESMTSEPVPITVDGVDVSTLDETLRLPGPEVSPGSRSGRHEACAVREFPDVPRDHTFYAYVHWMACEELATGYQDGLFGVTGQLTRSEAANVLYRLSGESHDPGTAPDFDDVPVGDSAFAAVSWMKQMGYAKGYADGNFGRNTSISRGELAAFLYRMSGQAYRVTAYSPYADMAPRDAYFAEAAWLHSTGIITGYADRSFQPRRPVTRGEAAKFIYSFDQVVTGVLPVPTDDRWTTVVTPLHATADPQTKAVRNLPSQTGVVRLAEQGSMTRVKTGTTTGWVNSDFLSTGRPGTTAKPYPAPTKYEQRAANNMAPWCWDIPMAETFDGTHAWAQFTARGFPEWPSTYQVSELIGLGHDLDPDSVPARAVQLHECAHILQYRAYRYDGRALDSRMDRLYPKGSAGGTEHMADCMADAMGARRVSTFGGATWTVGYGGACTSAQLAAARKVIAGVRP